MDFTNVCPNCGPCGEGHRCVSNEEDMINQTDDNEDSTPFLDKVVKESMSYDESTSTAVERNDFATSDIEKSQENSMEGIEDGFDSPRLHSYKENPLISEGKADSPPDEESFMEENQEEASEENRELHESFENDPEFLSFETLSFSDEPATILLLDGNPLQGLPFQPLFADESRGSNQNKDTNLESAVERKRQEIRRRSMGLSSDSQASPSKKDCNGHSSSKSKKRRLKQKSTESFPRDQCGRTFSSEESHMFLRDHSYSSKEASVDLPSSSQAGPSRLCSSEHSETDSTKSPLKHSPKKSFSCDLCDKKFISNRNLRDHRFLHSNAKPHICKECAKGFAQKSYLKHHNRVHTGERRYKCNVCGKRFSQS
ncbi:unnamed protein product [Larinioides sclopetarius]|uniref:C2H2-type domain-containing protein n=1 Tax=Larinioides sclopetarius TaxID=280406 RepID=A0AAV2BP00_9ARAC